MTKIQFIIKLRQCLSEIPKDEVEERIGFYCEMIEDRMEEGLTEQEAVASIGEVEDIARQIIADTCLSKPVKKKRELKAWQLILMSFGAVICFPLALALCAVVLSLYVAFWSVIASIYSLFTSFILAAVTCLFTGIGFLLSGNVVNFFAFIGAAFVYAGISVFAFYGGMFCAKGAVRLVNKFALWIKGIFAKRSGYNEEKN